jgi:rod shape-determining protein MreD
MKALWTAAAILAALIVQSALSASLPSQGRILDPFLIVVVYCGLTGGEIHGMLAGVAAGWVQDIHFGGPVAGLSALTKLLLGFGVGVAGTRFFIQGTAPRLLTLFTAAAVDAVLFEKLAMTFDVPTNGLSPLGLLARASVNALVGVAAFELLDLRRRRQEARP